MLWARALSNDFSPELISSDMAPFKSSEAKPQMRHRVMHDYAKTPEIQVGKSDGSRYSV